MRHGQTVWNVQKRLQGRRDSPLTALGVSQAQAFGARLAQIIEKPSAVQAVSSPLGRAWQTAVLAVSGMGVDPSLIVLDDRLVEHAFGQWEGLVWDEVKLNHGPVLAARMKDRWNVPAPGGESFAMVAERVADWLSDQDEEETVLCFCHGVTSRVIRGLYAKLDRETIMSLEEPQDRIFVLSEGHVREVIA